MVNQLPSVLSWHVSLGLLTTLADGAIPILLLYVAVLRAELRRRQIVSVLCATVIISVATHLIDELYQPPTLGWLTVNGSIVRLLAALGAIVLLVRLVPTLRHQ